MLVPKRFPNKMAYFIALDDAHRKLMAVDWDKLELQNLAALRIEVEMKRAELLREEK